MKTQDQLLESIGRFQTSFWDKRTPRDRPPVGVAPDACWLPVNYLREAFTREQVQPEDVTPERVMTDYEVGFAGRAVVSDDFLPYAAAWRAVPWLEVCCGCPALYSEGSLAPGHIAETLADLVTLPIPADNAWLATLRRETQRLAMTAPADCWVSASILRGPSDVLAALRGLDRFYIDLYDDRALIAEAAGRVNQLLIDALAMHFESVPPKLGGYAHIFGYWAPGPTYVIQEDAMGMCSPAVYREVFWPGNCEVVERFGDHVLFHVHSTGIDHVPDALAIPGLAGMELTVESNGPPLVDLVPVLRAILERGRLILCVDHGFDRLPAVLRQLPHEGLYLVVNDRFLPTEAAFRDFAAAHWGARP